MFWITIGDFEAICFNTCVELYSFNQPIPPFATRFSGILESSLASPLQQSTGQDLYPDIEDKLAALFYFMIKNHPFINGNKRMAITTLLVTLYGNDKWLVVSERYLYNLAKRVH